MIAVGNEYLANSTAICAHILELSTVMNVTMMVQKSQAEGILGGTGNLSKHLLGVFIVNNALKNAHTLHRGEISSLYDSSAPGWPSPDELHGAIWQFLVMHQLLSDWAFW